MRLLNHDTLERIDRFGRDDMIEVAKEALKAEGTVMQMVDQTRQRKPNSPANKRLGIH